MAWRDFDHMYKCEPNDERKRIQHYRDATAQRIRDLNDKIPKITQAEKYELDMCKADLKRADEWLKKN